MTNSKTRKKGYTMKQGTYHVRLGRFFTILVIGMVTTQLVCAQSDSATTPNKLKQLSMEELLGLEVTLVSRTPQKLTGAASAVQVISGEAIRQSGAISVPEALRLFTNLQVAQLNANAWIISARGFNTVFANKLLVMIDGRTVYTPLFGGVIWEQQNILMEDIDRIEVVSGPGATLWGANAVNGVINIISKKTTETQGLYVSALGGSFVQDVVAVRYGGEISPKLTYKVYGQHFDRNPTTLPDGTKNTDRWRLTQSGFRLDYDRSVKDGFALQGDIYGGTRRTPGGNSDLEGLNVLARWRHEITAQSAYVLQLYYDQYFRDDIPGQGADKLTTMDLDFQHHLPISKKQQFTWGVGYRAVKDKFTNKNPLFGISPSEKNLDLLDVFVQDEISLTDRLKLTLGSKLLHNVYTGLEWQPGIRMGWQVNSSHMLWTAVSRAVRTPSRLDVDYYLPIAPQPPTVQSVAGGPNFVSEKMVAFEAGYRLQPGTRTTLSIATFYNSFDDIYSVEALPGTVTYQIQNGVKGASWGLEFSGTWQPFDNWRLRGGYTYFDKDLAPKPGRLFNPDYLGNDVKNQVSLQSMLNITPRWHFSFNGRYLDRIEKTLATEKVPAYLTFDLRLAYQVNKWEFVLAGQNLAQAKHTEFNINQIPRSVYAQVNFRR